MWWYCATSGIIVKYCLVLFDSEKCEFKSVQNYIWRRSVWIEEKGVSNELYKEEKVCKEHRTNRIDDQCCVYIYMIFCFFSLNSVDSFVIVFVVVVIAITAVAFALH